MVNLLSENIFKAVGADAVVTEAADLRLYLTGFSSSAGIVITDEKGTTLYTDSRYIEAAKNFLDGKAIQVKEIYRGFKLNDLLKDYKTLGVPFGRIDARAYQSFINGGFNLIDSTSTFENFMKIKRPDEIENIKLACAAADSAYTDLLPEIKEGMTENEVAALLEYLMRKHGASTTSFETICAFGGNGSVPHHETGNTKLKFGDAVLIDFGCKVNGYCSDCTRTFLFGDDGKHAHFKEVYQRVLEAHMLVKEKFHSSMTGREGDAIARDYLAKYGLDKYFTHTLGHGIGINIHEYPSLSPACEEKFCDGMVFSDEPGCYFAGELGIRIEDTVMLGNGNVVSLTDTDKKLTIL